MKLIISSFKRSENPKIFYNEQTLWTSAINKSLSYLLANSELYWFDESKYQYIFIVKDSTIFRTILEKNKCDKCNLTIHPNFIGNHKCDHQNCPICKSPITPSQYWFHVRSHPGHENDSPPTPKVSTFENRRNASYSGYGNYRRNSWGIISF